VMPAPAPAMATGQAVTTVVKAPKKNHLNLFIEFKKRTTYVVRV